MPVVLGTIYFLQNDLFSKFTAITALCRCSRIEWHLSNMSKKMFALLYRHSLLISFLVSTLCVAMAEQLRYNQSDLQNQSGKKQKPEHSKRFFSENHSFKKRPTSKPYQRKEDIYVTNKSNFKVNKIKRKIVEIFRYADYRQIICKRSRHK